MTAVSEGLPKLFTLAFCLLFFIPNSFGQTSQLVPLVTDQTPMGLSPDFGVPATRVVNQSGDYAFVGEGNSAIFFLSHTASSGNEAHAHFAVRKRISGFPRQPDHWSGQRAAE